MFDFILDRLYLRQELRALGISDRMRHELEAEGLLTPIRLGKSGWRRYSGTQIRELLEAKSVAAQAAGRRQESAHV